MGHPSSSRRSLITVHPPLYSIWLEEVISAAAVWTPFSCRSDCWFEVIRDIGYIVDYFWDKHSHACQSCHFVFCTYRALKYALWNKVKVEVHFCSSRIISPKCTVMFSLGINECIFQVNGGIKEFCKDVWCNVMYLKATGPATHTLGTFCNFISENECKKKKKKKKLPVPMSLRSNLLLSFPWQPHRFIRLCPFFISWVKIFQPGPLFESINHLVTQRCRILHVGNIYEMQCPHKTRDGDHLISLGRMAVTRGSSAQYGVDGVSGIIIRPASMQ